MQKGELDLALADLNEAARVDSSNFYAFWNRGAVYAAQGNYRRAQEDLTAALALNPDKSSKAKIQEALNAVTAGVESAVKAEQSNQAIITDPSRLWGSQQGLAGSAASNDAATPSLMLTLPSGSIQAMPAAPSTGPAVIPSDR
jgi:tetratricopeptide (TPR) repeat protein